MLWDAQPRPMACLSKSSSSSHQKDVLVASTTKRQPCPLLSEQGWRTRVWMEAANDPLLLGKKAAPCCASGAVNRAPHRMMTNVRGRHGGQLQVDVWLTSHEETHPQWVKMTSLNRQLVIKKKSTQNTNILYPKKGQCRPWSVFCVHIQVWC